MPRLPRCTPPEVPQHIIQRGNDRQSCFTDDADRAVYFSCLDAASRRYCVDIHAWVLMTNHVHLLATPHGNGKISAMMQDLGRAYVSWFNQRHARTGTLWEGRFRSCLVDSDGYLLRCYRYIELNPVRAGIVADPAQYAWSSYRSNAMGRRSRLLTPHETYLVLGTSMKDRTRHYRELFLQELDPEQIAEIRTSVNKGLALGSEHFKTECEARHGRRFRPEAGGRPRVLTKKPGSDPLYLETGL